jgi:hypothetical protein
MPLMAQGEEEVTSAPTINISYSDVARATVAKYNE